MSRLVDIYSLKSSRNYSGVGGSSTGPTGPQGIPGIASNTGATGPTGPAGSLGYEPFSGKSRLFPLIQVLPYDAFSTNGSVVDTRWTNPGYDAPFPHTYLYNPGVFSVQIGTPDLGVSATTNTGKYKLINYDRQSYINDQTSTGYATFLRLEGTGSPGLYNLSGCLTFPLNLSEEYIGSRGILVTIGAQNLINGSSGGNFLPRLFAGGQSAIGNDFNTINFDMTLVIDDTYFSNTNLGPTSIGPYCDINIGIINNNVNNTLNKFGYYNSSVNTLQSGNIATGSAIPYQPIYNTIGPCKVGQVYIDTVGGSYICMTKLADFNLNIGYIPIYVNSGGGGKVGVNL
jgi:hypothetical protein